MAQETITAEDILRRSLERNRYFYGKLMTVRDFTQEQLYFNAKRWLLNRLVFGSGVICGLDVEPGSGLTILIKSGLAIDPVGREVTIAEDAPVDLAKVVKLGGAPFTGDKTGFICLAERDCPRDPVPALTASPCDDTCESNRWKESFEVSWDEETTTEAQPAVCETWLNRATISAVDANSELRVERTTPVWVRAGETFEVVVRVTALQDVNAVRISEQVEIATVLEPTPLLGGTGQFPTTPVNLKAGEFFVYVYQIKAPDNLGPFRVSGSDSTPPVSTIKVVSAADADDNETQFELWRACGDPKSLCVRIAKLNVHFTDSKPDGFNILGFAAPRFRYSLERVTQLLDCVRASLLAQAGSARPGHAFITFNDLETTDLKPIGDSASHGNAFTVTRGDHVHALLRAPNSGLEFVDTNQLRINGTIGGEAIRFLNIVKGQGPVADDDLVTKSYVDAHIAGLDWQESVLDKDLTAPPEKPKDGDRYLLFNDPTATWRGNGTRGRKNDIVTFEGKLWEITTPDEGTAIFVEDENVAYLFVDGSWIPFLAAPTVAAGDGLVAKKAIFSVGQGAGIVVNPDDVAVAFYTNAPEPIGLAASPGAADSSSRGDHVHSLPLQQDSGLVFQPQGLRIDGAVAGEKINFLNPVAGQEPQVNEHLTTKKYVDDHISAINAGDGLVRKNDTIFVGQGAGIQVNPDDVAVIYEAALPQPIAPNARTGVANSAARGDHAHSLRVSELGGLVFDEKGLRIEGLVGGTQIRFVNRVSGQDPVVNEDLVTKRYVDAKVVPAQPVIAGGGLVLNDHTISVGQGEGVVIGEDSVAVQFSKSIPLVDALQGNPGNEPAAARGDHVHPLPKSTPATASGIVNFKFSGNPQSTAESDFIDPGLGNGKLCVALALVTSPDSYLCGDISNTHLKLFLDLTADVRVPGAPKPSVFRILLDSVRSDRPLPEAFQVRWFAYLPAVEAQQIEVIVPSNSA